MDGAEAVWCVYLIRCANGALYCGIAKDAAKRFAAHRAGKGAKYTRMHKPLEMRVIVNAVDKSGAAVWEAAVKKMPREDKLAMWADGVAVGTAADG